jgi:hypothetical protein
MPRPTVTTHLIEIDPPSDHRTTYVATCKAGDFSRSYLNRVEAFTAGTTHINEVVLANELEQGRYEAAMEDYAMHTTPSGTWIMDDDGSR